MAPHDQLNLDLPPVNPELTKVLAEASCSNASFALYSLVPDIPPARLEEICNIPQDEWEENSMENQCVKPAQPTFDFSGKNLADVIAAHAAMDKELVPTDGGAADAGWWPHIFVVATNKDIEDHGLLLVYVDNPYHEPENGEKKKEEGEGTEDGSEAGEDAAEPEGPTLKKFFFKPEDMSSILSGIALSDEDPSWLHKEYDMDGEHGDDSNADEEEMEDEK